MIIKVNLILLMCVLVTTVVRSNSYILKSLDTSTNNYLQNNMKPLVAFYDYGFKPVGKIHILNPKDVYSGDSVVKNIKPFSELYSDSKQMNKRYIIKYKDTQEGTQNNLKLLDVLYDYNGSKEVKNRIYDWDSTFGAGLTIHRAPVYEPKMATRTAYETNTAINVGKCPAGYHRMGSICILNDQNYDD